MDPTLPLLAVAAVDGSHRSSCRPGQCERGSHAAADLLALLRRPTPRMECLHCGHDQLQRWGRWGLRQRYRCRACGRTFNELSGTALHRLKRKDLWPAYCQCILAGMTVRAAARLLGIHRDTAFRWRHRLLRKLNAGEQYPLGRRVTVGPARVYGRYWILFALDEKGRAAGAAVGSRPPDCADVRVLLQHRLERRAVLFSVEGPFGAAARFARLAGHRWMRRQIVDPQWNRLMEPIPSHAFRFRRWLKRFRGVADHYLDHYLAWFRLADGALWNGVCRPGGGAP